MTEKLKAVTGEFSEKLKRLLADGLVGVYLTGSAALGGYHDGRSDIDFTVVTKEPTDEKHISGLQAVHREMLKKYPKNVLEGHYVTITDLGRDPDEIKPVLTYYKGKLSTSYHGISIVTWYTLKKYGVTVYGPPCGGLAFDAPEEKLLAYTIKNVNSYWTLWLSGIRKPLTARSVFALTDAGVEWGVLGISRMFFTLSERDVSSKDSTAEYSLLHAPEALKNIIAEAQSIRLGLCGSYRSLLRRRRDMAEYMEHMINECNRLASGIPALKGLTNLHP